MQYKAYIAILFKQWVISVLSAGLNEQLQWAALLAHDDTEGQIIIKTRSSAASKKSVHVIHQCTERKKY